MQRPRTPEEQRLRAVGGGCFLSFYGVLAWCVLPLLLISHFEYALKDEAPITLRMAALFYGIPMGAIAGAIAGGVVYQWPGRATVWRFLLAMLALLIVPTVATLLFGRLESLKPPF
jgi:hypothetical protein